MNAVINKAKIDLFVPGRVCLMGEHADWAGQYGKHKGYCLVIGTDQGIHARAWADDELIVESQIPTADGQPSGRERRIRCQFTAESLLSAATDSTEFFRHCAGVALEVRRRYQVGGLTVHIHRMDLPLKKGVSSSAAVCATIAKAFDAVYALNLFPHELMDLAYIGERTTGSQCGRMDQACIFGKTPVLLTFDGPDFVRVEPIFPEARVEMFIVDLAGKKDTVRILADLQGAYGATEKLQQALGPDNERAVRLACRAVTRGDAAGLGEIMSASQQNFDAKVASLCPSELQSPLLHKLLQWSDLQPHVYGGKGVGSQGDGTAQFVARSVEDRDEAMAMISSEFPAMRCFPLTIGPVNGKH